MTAMSLLRSASFISLLCVLPGSQAAQLRAGHAPSLSSASDSHAAPANQTIMHMISRGTSKVDEVTSGLKANHTSSDPNWDYKSVQNEPEYHFDYTRDDQLDHGLTLEKKGKKEETEGEKAAEQNNTVEEKTKESDNETNGENEQDGAKEEEKKEGDGADKERPTAEEAAAAKAAAEKAAADQAAAEKAAADEAAAAAEKAAAEKAAADKAAAEKAAADKAAAADAAAAEKAVADRAAAKKAAADKAAAEKEMKEDAEKAKAVSEAMGPAHHQEKQKEVPEEPEVPAVPVKVPEKDFKDQFP